MDAASRLNVDGNTKNYVFVNALGLGARNLGGGEKMFSTRAQTVYVEGEAANVTLRAGEWGLAYVIPRRGMAILCSEDRKRLAIGMVPN